MKMLNTPQEIAVAINMHEMPVVRIDLADADEYGIKSQKVLIDNGKFRRLNPTDPDMPYLVRAEIRAFVDEKKFMFASYGCCLSNTFGYHDMEELLDYANAPLSSGIPMWCWQSWIAAGGSHTSRSSCTQETALTRTVRFLSASSTRTMTQPSTSGPRDAASGKIEEEPA